MRGAFWHYREQAVLAKNMGNMQADENVWLVYAIERYRAVQCYKAMPSGV